MPNDQLKEQFKEAYRVWLEAQPHSLPVEPIEHHVARFVMWLVESPEHPVVVLAA